MKWEEFINERKEIPADYVLTDIECPKCGRRLYKYMGIALTSYPLKYRYDCMNCNWSGVA